MNNIEYEQTLCIGISFFAGFLFSPINGSILFFILFCLFYEFLAYYVYKYLNFDWCFMNRLSYFCAYFLGWLIGRYVKNL